MRRQGPYYYEFGLMAASIMDIDSAKALCRSLLRCFRDRFRNIMDLSNQTDHRDLYKSIQRLDATESEIYKAGQTDLIGFLKWQRREFCKLLPSIIVSANKNKRKRADSDSENQPA